VRKLVLLSIVLVLLFTISCGGVSKEAYDKTAGDLAVKVAQLDALNTKYEQVNGDFASANACLNHVKGELEIFNAIFIPAMTGDLENTSREEKEIVINELEANIRAMDDPVLSRKYNDMKYSGDDQAMVEFFLYLLEDMQRTLE